MPDATTTISLSISVPAHTAALAQARARELGRDLSSLVGEGSSVQALANDAAQQAFWRLYQRGDLPAEIVTEAEASANEQESARKARP